MLLRVKMNDPWKGKMDEEILVSERNGKTRGRKEKVHGRGKREDEMGGVENLG